MAASFLSMADSCHHGRSLKCHSYHHTWFSSVSLSAATPPPQFEPKWNSQQRMIENLRVFVFLRLHVWVHPERWSEGSNHLWEAWWTGNQVGLLFIFLFYSSTPPELVFYLLNLICLSSPLGGKTYKHMYQTTWDLYATSCSVGCPIRTSVSTTSRCLLVRLQA